MSTREKIETKALELFNSKGIEYVGMREVATTLNMRIGNITYYFPTKDELVMGIADQLRDRNTQTIDVNNCNSLKDFLLMYKQVFSNQYQYRCLFLSFVHIVSQNPLMARSYKETDRKRRKMLHTHISVLIKNGYLTKSAGKKSELIISHFSLVSRFWISEARISYTDWKIDKVIAHYLGLLYDVLHPYVTNKGKKEVSGLQFLSEGFRK